MQTEYTGEIILAAICFFKHFLAVVFLPLFAVINKF